VGNSNLRYKIPACDQIIIKKSIKNISRAKSGFTGTWVTAGKQILKTNIMNKIKLGLMAMMAVTGIGSSFALNHHKALTGTKYYAQSIGTGQAKWVAVQPTTDCDVPSSLACTITSTSSGVTSLPANTFPAQFTILNGSGEAHE
jgi:hypothetical protein